MEVPGVGRGETFEQGEDDVEILLARDDLRVEVGGFGEVAEFEGLGLVAALDGGFGFLAAGQGGQEAGEGGQKEEPRGGSGEWRQAQGRR